MKESKIIYKDGKPHIKGKVVMLPTEKVELGTIMKYIKRMEFHDNAVDKPVGSFVQNINRKVTVSNEYWQGYHLYLLSDEEIKEGDWGYHKKYGVKRFESHFSKENWNKIIAPINPELNPNASSNYTRENGIEGLARLSEQFLQEWVNNPVEEVLVEIEQAFVNYLPTYSYTIKTSPDNTVSVRFKEDDYSDIFEWLKGHSLGFPIGNQEEFKKIFNPPTRKW